MPRLHPTTVVLLALLVCHSTAIIRRPGPLGRRSGPIWAAIQQADVAPDSGEGSGASAVVVDGRTLALDGRISPETIRELEEAGDGRLVFIYANNSDTNISTAALDTALLEELRNMLAAVLRQGEQTLLQLQDIQQQL